MAIPMLIRPALGASYYSNYATTSAPTYASSSSAAAAAEGSDAAASGVWNYMLGVSIFLVVWVCSLMLPKGARKQFFGANPRRYTRRRYPASELGDLSTTLSAMDSVDESILAEVEKRRMHDMSVSMAQSSTLPSTFSHHHQQQQQQQQRRHPQSRGSTTTSDSESGVESLYLRPMARSTARRGAPASSSLGSSMLRASPAFGSAPPSPGHPAIQRLPSAKILNETMQRLKSRGIRLVAHGVASDSKRVWIKFEEETASLSWQTEFPRKIPNQLGEVSLVMMRGALHRIALPNILYVDVGKKTNALMKTENKEVLDSVCFSLLTQNGSLDLQANSRLERDALVSCFSMILDEVHTQDWRSLYAESPETSAVQSSCTGSDLNQVEF